MHALEPLVAVLVGLLQRHVQVVVRLLRGKVLQRMKQARFHSLLLKQGQAASRYLAFTLAKFPDPDYCTHYDVELGVDIDQLVLVVHDGQRRDSEVDKLVERLDDGRVVVRDLDVVVGPDVEIPDGALEVARLRQVVYLRGKGVNRHMLAGWVSAV